MSLILVCVRSEVVVVGIEEINVFIVVRSQQFRSVVVVDTASDVTDRCVLLQQLRRAMSGEDGFLIAAVVDPEELITSANRVFHFQRMRRDAEEWNLAVLLSHRRHLRRSFGAEVELDDDSVFAAGVHDVVGHRNLVHRSGMRVNLLLRVSAIVGKLMERDGSVGRCGNHFHRRFAFLVEFALENVLAMLRARHRKGFIVVPAPEDDAQVVGTGQQIISILAESQAVHTAEVLVQLRHQLQPLDGVQRSVEVSFKDLAVVGKARLASLAEEAALAVEQKTRPGQRAVQRRVFVHNFASLSLRFVDDFLVGRRVRVCVVISESSAVPQPEAEQRRERRTEAE